jgi:hypothetical protein
MKHSIVCLLSFLLTFGINLSAQDINRGKQRFQNTKQAFTELEGIFLGQKPPGISPEIFAPELISTGLNESVITFMPDGSECYWSISIFGLETILTSKLINKEWTKPEIAPFAGKYYDGWPAIQPDGKRMFFHSSRPVSDSTLGISAEFNIWYMDRINGEWSEPIIIESSVNSAENSTCPSVTNTGILYFSKRFNDDTEKLVRSKSINDNFQDIEVLPDHINSMKDNFHGVISPDETYLIRPLYGRKDAIGNRWNYYVSFRDEDDTWSELINLGESVNSLFCGGSTAFSPDGKYLFFQASIAPELLLALPKRHNLKELVEIDLRTPGRGSNDIYWISVKIIEELRPKLSEHLKGLYLGQKPPGNTPEIFAPGFISTDVGELNSIFTSDGKEFYFSRRGVTMKPSTLMVTRIVNGEWTKPEPVRFSGINDDIDLFITPDGNSLIFCSGKVQRMEGRPFIDHDFWISKRVGEEWEQPVIFAPEAVSEYEDYYPIVTKSGNLYFNSQRGGQGSNDIYCSEFIDGKYTAAEKLPKPINTEYREFDAFVSQDERMMILSSDKPGGLGGSDIYISFKNIKGEWSEPKNLGRSVNSEYSEYGATITPDGKFLFFTSTRNGSEDIFWISAKIIEELRPKE